jgi:hypothetical protein
VATGVLLAVKIEEGKHDVVEPIVESHESAVV